MEFGLIYVITVNTKFAPFVYSTSLQNFYFEEQQTNEQTFKLTIDFNCF